MNQASRITLYMGILVLALSIANGLSANSISPEFQRSEILSGMSGVGLMLVSVLLTEVIPKQSNKKDLSGDEGLIIDQELNEEIKRELAWGSHQFLTATPASTILVRFKNKNILRRGILGDGHFCPGPICSRAKETGELISLVKTTLYPGRVEFDPICKNLPSILVYPLKKDGFVIIGGWSERCFTKSDEAWLIGWSERLIEIINSQIN